MRATRKELSRARLMTLADIMRDEVGFYRFMEDCRSIVSEYGNESKTFIHELNRLTVQYDTDERIQRIREYKGRIYDSEALIQSLKQMERDERNSSKPQLVSTS